MARTTNKAEDLITFSRASTGTALTKVAYGPELVTNGAFDTDLSDWNELATVGFITWSDGAAVWASGGRFLTQYNPPLETGKFYEVTIDIEVTSGSLRLGTGALDSGTTLSSTGIHTFLKTPQGALSQYGIYMDGAPGNFVGQVNSISVKEVLYNDPTGTLKLISHPTDKPRVEYDANGVAKGLLIEEARTNLLTYSEDFTQWTQSQVTISSNAIEAPDGTLTATKTIEDQTSNFHYVQKSSFGAGSYTYSVFLKAAERKYAGIHIHDGTARGCSIDLETGTLGTPYGGATATATSFPNGWWRLSVAVTTTGSGQSVVYSSTSNALASYLGDGASGIYIYGAQVETGSFPTSYIPTSGATATRSADVANVPIDQFGYNAAQGVILVEASSFTKDYSNKFVFSLNGTGNSDLSASTHSSLQWRTFSSAGTISYFGDAASIESGNKFAVMYDNVGAGTVADGTVFQSGTVSYTVTDPDMISIGSTSVGTVPLNGHIKSIKYYPIRLSNTKLQELTS